MHGSACRLFDSQVCRSGAQYNWTFTAHATAG
jgi:hypothetical protein